MYKKVEVEQGIVGISRVLSACLGPPAPMVKKIKLLYDGQKVIYGFTRRHFRILVRVSDSDEG
jgi:hypothetical protein